MRACGIAPLTPAYRLWADMDAAMEVGVSTWALYRWTWKRPLNCSEFRSCLWVRVHSARTLIEAKGDISPSVSPYVVRVLLRPVI